MSGRAVFVGHGAGWRYYGRAADPSQVHAVSPVAESRSHAGRALAVAGAGVVVALGLAFAVANLASRGKVQVNLGSETFSQQDAEDAAERIAKEGPILYADTAGGDRDIVLQHLGDDPQTGWLALAARPAGVSRGCTIQSRRSRPAVPPARRVGRGVRRVRWPRVPARRRRPAAVPGDRAGREARRRPQRRRPGHVDHAVEIAARRRRQDATAPAGRRTCGRPVGGGHPRPRSGVAGCRSRQPPMVAGGAMGY